MLLKYSCLKYLVFPNTLMMSLHQSVLVCILNVVYNGLMVSLLNTTGGSLYSSGIILTPFDTKSHVSFRSSSFISLINYHCLFLILLSIYSNILWSIKVRVELCCDHMKGKVANFSEYIWTTQLDYPILNM